MRIRTMTVMALGTACWLASGAAQAQSGTCTPITTAPNVITSPGVYCLTGNLTNTSIHAAAIAVNSSGVVLDLNGWRLRWSGSTSSGNPAVSVQLGQENVTIRNGLISGFEIGIESFASGTIVEDMRLHNNGLGVAIRAGDAGGAIIRRNSIRLGNGIQIDSNAARLVDNDIYGPERVDGAPGINGIAIYGQNAMVVGNRLSRLYSGIWIDILTQATGKYRDNMATNVTVPYTGGTDAGNND